MASSFLSARVFNGCRALLAPASSSAAAKTASVKAPSKRRAAVSSETAGKPKNKAASSKNKAASSSLNRTPAKPTGILKASPVSPALAEFLGSGEASRADAVKQIWTYVKSNDLQNPTDKREILCDDKLKDLFDGKDKVGFLEIGKLLSHHFVKSVRM